MIAPETICQFLRDYWHESGFRAIEVDAVGKARSAPLAGKARNAWRAALFGEAVRWGEACVMTDASGLAGWGIPIMTNSIVTGGIVVEDVALDDGDPAEISRRIQSAAEHLLAKMESYNLTNAEFLKARQRGFPSFCPTWNHIGQVPDCPRFRPFANKKAPSCPHLRDREPFRCLSKKLPTSAA